MYSNKNNYFNINILLTKENLDNLEKNKNWILYYYLSQIDITDDIYEVNNYF